MLVKKIESEIAIMTSGRTIGKKLIVWMYARPKNLYHVTPRAASVPNTVAASDDVIAIIMLVRSDFHSGMDEKKSCWYHTSDSPENVLFFELLKE